MGTNRAPFQQFLLPAGKEKARNHAGLRDFGGYGKEGKVSIVNMIECAEKLRRLNPMQRMIMIAKIDALYERQEMEKEMKRQQEERELETV